MSWTPYLVHLGILVGIYILYTASLNLAIGYTGLLNLGHVAFFGIGAYGSALLAMQGWPLWAAMLGGIVFAAIAGALLAIPTSRTRRGVRVPTCRAPS